MRVLGEELATELGEAERLEYIRKSIAEEQNAMIKKRRAKASAIACTMNQRFEMIPTSCQVTIDLENKTRSLTRRDTGQVIETRDLDGQEVKGF